MSHHTGGKRKHGTAWEAVVLPTAAAIVRFNAGDVAGAAALLEPAQARFIELGGSAVERGVFSDLLLHVQIGAGRRVEARAALDALRRRKGDHLSVRRFATLIDA